MVIKRVAPLSFAKIAGTLYAILGFIIGGIVSLLAMAGAFTASNSDASFFGPVLGLIVGIGAIVILPLLYGGMGFIVSFVGAWLYNAVSAMVGGVEIEVQ